MTRTLSSRLQGRSRRFPRAAAAESAGDRGILQDLVQRLRALHTVVLTPGGVALCEHCCFNRIQQRRLACSQHHRHDIDTAPCETLALLSRLGL